MATYICHVDLSIVDLKTPFILPEIFHTLWPLTNMKSIIPRKLFWWMIFQFSFHDQWDLHIPYICYMFEVPLDNYMVLSGFHIVPLPTNGREEIKDTNLLLFHCTNRSLLIGLYKISLTWPLLLTLIDSLHSYPNPSYSFGLYHKLKFWILCSA